MVKLIDTHNHVLPSVDDGSQSWETSLRMLQQAQLDGIVELVCTPHVLSNKDLDEEEKFISKYNELIEKAENSGIKIKIHLGAELYIQPDLKLEKRIATFANNGRYFLLEFPMSMIPPFAATRFFEVLDKKYTAVIAHPERNAGILNDPLKAYELVRKGALLQVTAGSLLGLFGNDVKLVSSQLMDSNIVHIVATDAHDLNRRTLELRKAYDYVASKWGQERAELLFTMNPGKLINGQDIDIGKSLPMENRGKPTMKKRFQSFFSR